MIKPRTRTFLLLLLALICGGVAGVCVATHYSQAALGQYAVMCTADSANGALSALKRLRHGDTNRAIRLLETHLDGLMIVLQSMLDDMPQPRRDTRAVQLLERARTYRAEHPIDTSAIEESK